jgi:hypothetical protein
VRHEFATLTAETAAGARSARQPPRESLAARLSTVQCAIKWR